MEMEANIIMTNLDIYFFGIPADYNSHFKEKNGASYLTNPFDKDIHPANMLIR